MLELYSGLGAMAVKNLNQFFKSGDMLITAQTELPVGKITLKRWGGDLNDNETDAALGPSFKIIYESLADETSLFVIACSHGR
jgi:hypothetical protein